MSWLGVFGCIPPMGAPQGPFRPPVPIRYGVKNPHPHPQDGENAPKSMGVGTKSPHPKFFIKKPPNWGAPIPPITPKNL